MTDTDRPLCDSPELCGCYDDGYAAGKEMTYFEIEMVLQNYTHAARCGCQPCQVKKACLRKVMTRMARSSPALFDLVEGRVWDDHNNRN